MNILIAGPECSGKSHLSAELADHYHAVVLPEFAVDYLENIHRAYKFEDLASIASGHFKMLKEYKIQFPGSVFFLDTWLINIKIWSLYRFGKSDPLIDELLADAKMHYVLLLRPNIPWEMAKFRENPGDREHLFNMYLHELSQREWPFSIVDDLGEARTQQAISILDSTIPELIKR